jgi:hypothetical protein
MKTVDQSLLVERDGNGDCWSACLATLLGVPITDVPAALSEDRGGSSSQTWATQEWLALWGLDVSWRDFTNPECPALPEGVLGASVILVGPSPRDRFVQHAVIGAIDDVAARAFRVIHDPHPSRAGILSLSQAWWLVRPCSVPA